ncbi:JmjC domain-containing protein [Pseudomonas bohemica]|uniref:JmjC domain-containing protein n=1 Tax=Pseudomonas bohemica TaxID=2044872 RepID=UPI0018FE6D89|nr:cupin domain-containing protein [Pseudomonas bohemica]
MPKPSLLDQLFGDAATAFVAGWPSEVRIDHGDPARLPALFQQSILQNVEQLADRYRGRLSFGRGLRSPKTFDSNANAASLLQLGLTVFFQDVAGSVPGAVPFLRQLEVELGVVAGSARLSAFASSGDDGVSCHYDAEEVISIQLLGRKTFHVAPMTQIEHPYGAQFGPEMVAVENLYEQAREGFPDTTDANFSIHTLQPGSVLYLPRGTWHRTEAQEPSLSLSIVIRPPVLADALLGWLKPWLLGDARWRRPLYGDRDQHSVALKPLLGELAQRLTQDAEAPILSWSSAPAVETTDLLRVPGSRITWLEPAIGAPARLRLQVHALDQDWRERVTLDTEIPAALLSAIAWIDGRVTAFSLEQLDQQLQQLPGIAHADLRQLLDLLVKAHALRQLVPR